ncbi:MAG: hypothetical protein E6H78_14780, partial [Betaproteobacteria bacterium]
MSGLCGWINVPAEDGEALATADSMRRALRDRDAEAPRPMIAVGCALAVEPGIRPVSLHQSDALLAAIEGRVRWRSSDLGALARESGDAAALAEAYRRHGTNCLQEISGPFAVAVVDTRHAGGLLAI